MRAGLFGNAMCWSRAELLEDAWQRAELHRCFGRWWCFLETLCFCLCSSRFSGKRDPVTAWALCMAFRRDPTLPSGLHLFVAAPVCPTLPPRFSLCQRWPHFSNSMWLLGVQGVFAASLNNPSQNACSHSLHSCRGSSSEPPPQCLRPRWMRPWVMGRKLQCSLLGREGFPCSPCAAFQELWELCVG